MWRGVQPMRGAIDHALLVGGAFKLDPSVRCYLFLRVCGVLHAMLRACACAGWRIPCYTGAIAALGALAVEGLRRVYRGRERVGLNDLLNEVEGS